MIYLVALNIQSRFSRPPIGLFAYSDKHQRHVWKGKELTDIADLAAAVNEALAFVRQMDQVDLVVGVYQVASPATIEAAPEADDFAPPESPIEQNPSPRIKRRLLTH
jgi:hypothetical protein